MNRLLIVNGSRRLFLLAAIVLCLCGCGPNNDKGVSLDLNVVLSSYLELQHQHVKAISLDRETPIAPEYKEFFRQAHSGDWQVAFALYEGFKNRSGQWWTGDKVDPMIGNDLWNPIHELAWTYNLFRLWDSDLLEQYASGIIDSLPEGSIFFAGTDSGRFLIKAFCDVNRPSEVFVITQNQLSDSRYLHYLQQIYSEFTKIPSDKRVSDLYQQYYSARHAAAEQIDRKRVTRANVWGFASVMAQEIFEKNKNSHEIFVEESYVMKWMTPYLTPYKLVMKLNKKKTTITDEMIQEDMDYWSKYVGELLANKKYSKSHEARITYSKMRAGIARLYAARGKLCAAERAFKQAVNLYPASMEPSARLAQEVYLKQGEYQKAHDVLLALKQVKSKHFDKADTDKYADRLIREIKRLDELTSKIARLEEGMAAGTTKLGVMVELLELYGEAGYNARAARMVNSVLKSDKVPDAALQKISLVLEETKNFELMKEVAEVRLKSKPSDWLLMLDLAYVEKELGLERDMHKTLKKAVKIAGDLAKRTINEDKRFKDCDLKL